LRILKDSSFLSSGLFIVPGETSSNVDLFVTETFSEKLNSKIENLRFRERGGRSCADHKTRGVNRVSDQAYLPKILPAFYYLLSLTKDHASHDKQLDFF